MSRGLSEWHRRVALDIAQAFPLVAIRATENHLVAAQDEPEPSYADDLHLAEVSEQERIAADLAEDTGKSARRHAVSDRRAVELQQQDLDAMRRAGL